MLIEMLSLPWFVVGSLVGALYILALTKEKFRLKFESVLVGIIDTVLKVLYYFFLAILLFCAFLVSMTYRIPLAIFTMIKTAWLMARRKEE